MQPTMYVWLSSPTLNFSVVALLDGAYQLVERTLTVHIIDAIAQTHHLVHFVKCFVVLILDVVLVAEHVQQVELVVLLSEAVAGILAKLDILSPLKR